MSRPVRALPFALVLSALLASVAAGGCKKRGEGGAPTPSTGAPSGSIVQASSAPNTAPPRFERFVDAHLDPAHKETIQVAGVTRDNAVVLVDFDASLAVKARRDLAQGFVAGDSTRVALEPGGLVVANGKLGGEAQTWLMQEGSAPRPMSPEWCESDHGVAWLVRDDAGVRVRFVRRASADGARAALDVTSALVGAPTSLAFLDCGERSVVVSLSENERRLVVRLSPASADFATAKPAPIEVEGPDDHAEDQRDLRVIARGEEVVVLFVGEQGSVSVRLLRAGQSTPAPWITPTLSDGAGAAGKPGKPFTYAFENDIVETSAASAAGGAIFLLSNEPMPPGGACPPNSEPVKTVLHTLTLDPEGKSATVATRPIVELPCGVETIPARLEPTGGGASVWWTEPVEDGSCAEVGLGIGAILEAASDKPGARRSKLLAEATVRLEDGRYLAVVRNGGCVPYATAGNGALVFAPAPK